MDHALDGRHVVARPNIVGQLEHAHEHRRYDLAVCRPVPLDAPQIQLGVETLHHHDGRADRDGRDDRAHVALEDVGAHAGDVAHVVADVVGNGGGVTRIVFGDTCFDLADQVSADVGSLGEDATAHTAKERNRAGAQTEGGNDLVGIFGGRPLNKEQVEEAQAEKAQARHGEAHDRATLECERQGLLWAFDRGLRSPGVGHRCDGHASPARTGRQNCADHIADCRERVQQDGDEHDHDEDEPGDPRVFLFQECS